MDSDILYMADNLSFERLKQLVGRENVKLIDKCGRVFEINRKVRVTVDERIPQGEITLIHSQ